MTRGVLTNKFCEPLHALATSAREVQLNLYNKFVIQYLRDLRDLRAMDDGLITFEAGAS